MTSVKNYEYKKAIWGGKEFWGLPPDFEPDWMYTEEQLKLRDEVIELCHTLIRPHAIHCDKTYEFPRKSLNALASLRLLGLVVPKELGGRGESHTCAAMIVETIARYGCPSTALVYTMHLGACATLCFRHHRSPRIKNLLSRLDDECLIGTLSYSDPATGGHMWYHLSSKVQQLDEETIKLLKYGSWATGAGMVDFYTIQTVSPGFNGDYADLTCFLVYADEVRASTEDWSSLGMHGNQSGPLIVEGEFKKDRLVGPIGDGPKSDDEVADNFFLVLTSATYNGLSLACMDLARKHVTRKTHGDVAMRVCDYGAIQDYFGQCLTSTTLSRTYLSTYTRFLDEITNNCDWSIHEDLNNLPRTPHVHWTWMAKLTAAGNVSKVADAMLHACGGTGFKTELGLERLLRDAKAGWVMSQSNELLCQNVGKVSLLGKESIDFWSKNCNERIVGHELNKMSISRKKELANELTNEVKLAESGQSPNHPYQDTDFDNPFNTRRPQYATKLSMEGNEHSVALSPDSWTTVTLRQRENVGKRMVAFLFALPQADCVSGCIAGQYLQAKIHAKGKDHVRYFSPVSKANKVGAVELVLRFETQGIVSNYFENMEIGQEIQLKGPCGGFEYNANELEELTLISAGAGFTPALQLIRTVMSNPSDRTHITSLYYCDKLVDVLYYDELKKYSGDARLNMVLSLGEAPASWDGEEGFVDEEMMKKYVKLPNGLKNKVVLCGGPTMVICCLHALKQLGFKSEDIYIYGQFGSEQIRSVYGRNTKLSNHLCTKEQSK